MLCKLSLSNIKKSFKDYAVYFVTLILGVCIFYVFNSIESQTAMLKVSESTNELIKELMIIMSGVSVFVSCILGFLIIYASRFLIKKRNKEFAIYMTLGMSKRKISMLLLLETLLIGVISLAIGLGLGVVISQVTSIFVANLFDADMSQFKFVFSQSATIKTILYFGIIYLIVMLFNVFIINKCKLIDLIQSSKKSEKIKLKNPILCIILFIISVAVLGKAYYMVVKDFYSLDSIVPPIVMGIAGTVGFFWSISGLILKIFSKMKNVYYKGLNSFVLRQISSKINTMVISISIICLMLFCTICILASSVSIKNFFNESLAELAPADVELELSAQEYDEEGNVIRRNVVDVEKIFSDENVLKDIKDLTIIKKYTDEKFTLKESYGEYFEEILKKYPYIRYEELVEIVTQSDYNKLAKVYNLEQVNLKSNEYIIVSNYETKLYNASLSMGSKLKIFGTELLPASNEVVDGFLQMCGNPANIGFVVVPDNVIGNNIDYVSQIVVFNYKNTNENEHAELNKKICKIDYDADYFFNSKLEIKEGSIGLSALATFVGLYLGLIFLISSAAILALKELSDSIDDKAKYKILRNIGVDEKQINKALFKQTLLLFMLPLSLAIVHTIFGIKFCKLILESLGINELVKPMIFTSLFMIAIYGGYFVVTYLCSKNVQRNK